MWRACPRWLTAAVLGLQIVDQRLEIARGIGPVKISTLQDLERGRALEIAALLHAPLEMARRAQHPMPTLQVLSALLGALDRQVCAH